MNRKETITTTWEVWHYDVWGNARDGYEVNDRSCFNRACVIECPVTIDNPGTPNEFRSAWPTEKQIREALDIKPRFRLTIDGDGSVIYVSLARDSYPLGELVLQSPDSLSPIGHPVELPEYPHDTLTDAITNLFRA